MYRPPFRHRPDAKNIVRVVARRDEYMEAMPRLSMPYPIDTAKLTRVRTMMKDQGLTALVCRAPDNLVYLANYWCMKGPAAHR